MNTNIEEPTSALDSLCFMLDLMIFKAGHRQLQGMYPARINNVSDAYLWLKDNILSTMFERSGDGEPICMIEKILYPVGDMYIKYRTATTVANKGN